ncbi:hypothetical protein BC828DRAFT_393205 [Blastocladiella britannica]|nr:hypothetical protein BC828DRAFT_393205 [Blastocladiella britannica]
MSEKTAVASNSSQFAYLEYFLQLSLNASSARILSAHALSNPHLNVQFEKRCLNILTLDTWIDPASLPTGNAEDEVLRRGFLFSPSTSPGIRVGIGSLNLEQQQQDGVKAKDGSSISESGKHLRRAILCKVGVGRSYINSHENAQHDALPDGYDSWYLPLEGRDSLLRQHAAGRGDQQNGTDTSHPDYYHEYYIPSAAQILPMYVVAYEYDPERERKLREKPMCDNCETALAEFHCAADAANLCKSCDTQLHSANKLASRHTRTPIGKGVDVFGNCRLHPEKQVEFFCSQCHVPVCVYCKMVGHHAAGEAAKHKLVSVSEAYTTVMAEAQLPDTILTSRKTAITNQLSLLSARAKALETHTQAIQNQIDDTYHRACAELLSLTRGKRAVLASDECELHRQRAEIERLELFLRYQQSGDATQFLFSWARHQQLRQEMHDFKFFRDKVDVQLDIKCAGTITVLADAGAAGSPPMPTLKTMSYSTPGSPLRAADGGALTTGGGGMSGAAPNYSSSRDSPVGRYSLASSPLKLAVKSNGDRGISLAVPPRASRGSVSTSGGGMMAGSSSSPSPTKAAASSGGSNTAAAAARRSPGDFFAEALGALDDASMLGSGNNGPGSAVRDFMTELSFADGEGYISDN